MANAIGAGIIRTISFAPGESGVGLQFTLCIHGYRPVPEDIDRLVREDKHPHEKDMRAVAINRRIRKQARISETQSYSSPHSGKCLSMQSEQILWDNFAYEWSLIKISRESQYPWSLRMHLQYEQIGRTPSNNFTFVMASDNSLETRRSSI